MSILLSNVSFSYPESLSPVLTNIQLSLSAHVTGIVGRNGSGKSTFLQLIAGVLHPTSGQVTSPPVGYLPQQLHIDPHRTVADLMGVGTTWRALSRIEAGSVEPADFEAVGDHWDVEARISALVARAVPSLSLDHILDRKVTTLSGGERIRLSLATLQASGAQVLVLDEPTNNLDAEGRAGLATAIAQWPGQVIVASHDGELLAGVDEIVEIYQGNALLYGGNYEAYVTQRDQNNEAALRQVRDAKSVVRAERRDFTRVQIETTRNASQNKKKFSSVSGGPRLSDATAQRAAAARRADRVKAAASKVESAREELARVERTIRDDDSIRIPVIDPKTARGRILATLHAGSRSITIGGMDRCALTGPNGSGKTTALRQLARSSHARIGYLDQNLDLPDGTVFDAVSSVAPSRLPHDTHELLAAFLLKGNMVHRDVSSLSGGERFRVALARLLVADPPPELLIFDEPTNNLDVDSVTQFVDALSQYRGAILLVSHDDDLLDRLEMTDRFELRHGQLR